MSYRDWHVGMKVVCIDAAGQRGFHKLLTEGRIYTIRSFFEHPDDASIGLHLRELQNEIHPMYGIERGYKPERFRPVQVRKTSIAIFEAMLTGKNAKVDA